MVAEPGDSMVPQPYGHMRASTADRERAVDVLKAAFAEGRLDHGEYAERVGQVYASRTYAELARLTADLPVGPLGTLAPAQLVPQPQYPLPGQIAASGPTAQRTSGMAVASLILAIAAFGTLGLTAIPAFALGIAAILRINRTGDRGAGLAAAAVILAPLAFLGYLVAL